MSSKTISIEPYSEHTLSGLHDIVKKRSAYNFQKKAKNLIHSTYFWLWNFCGNLKHINALEMIHCFFVYVILCTPDLFYTPT